MSLINFATLNSNFNYSNPFLLTMGDFYTTPSFPNNVSIFSQNPETLTNVPTIPLPKIDFSAIFNHMPSFDFGNILDKFTPALEKPTKNSKYETNTSSKIKPGLLKGKLKGKEALITQLCEKYNVDVGLVLAIIGQESGFGTSNLAINHNNFMGYRAKGDLGKDANGHGYFSTPEKGLEVAIKNIAKYPERYANKGVLAANMNYIDEIGKIYCETGTYATAIKNIYNKTVKKYLA